MFGKPIFRSAPALSIINIKMMFQKSEKRILKEQFPPENKFFIKIPKHGHYRRRSSNLDAIQEKNVMNEKNDF